MDNDISESSFPLLGHDRGSILFNSAGQARDLASAMVAQGSRSALLFTRMLDPLLYNNSVFAEGLLQLLRANPRSYCQVLVQDAENFAAQDSRLIAVAQTLSSYMQLRIVPEEAKKELQAFLVVDGLAYVRRPNSAIYEGEACFYSPREARDLSYLFDQWWQQGSELGAARRLYI